LPSTTLSSFARPGLGFQATLSHSRSYGSAFSSSAAANGVQIGNDRRTWGGFHGRLQLQLRTALDAGDVTGTHPNSVQGQQLLPTTTMVQEKFWYRDARWNARCECQDMLCEWLIARHVTMFALRKD
jgi:hypothetical protein